MKNPFNSITFNKLEKNFYAQILTSAMPYYIAVVGFDKVAGQILMAAVENMDRFNECKVNLHDLDKFLDVSENTRKKSLNVLRYMNFIETKNSNRTGGETTFKVNVQFACKGSIEEKMKMPSALNKSFRSAALVNGQICKDKFKKYKQFNNDMNQEGVDGLIPF